MDRLHQVQILRENIVVISSNRNSKRIGYRNDDYVLEKRVLGFDVNGIAKIEESMDGLCA